VPPTIVVHRRGEKPDWELKSLVNIYEGAQTVNRNFQKRLAYIKVEDASINALTILNSFAEFVSFTINKNMLDEVEMLGTAYLE